MRIGVISDIHIDEQKSEEELLNTLSQCINDKNVDVMLVAGDISESYKKSIEFMRKLKKAINAKLYYTAGNHDLWSKHNEDENIDSILDKFSEEEGFVHNKAVELSDDVVLIAGCGWYDYSFASSEYKLDELEEKCYLEKTWQDKLYAKHQLSDIELHDAWNEEFISLIMQYSHKKVIFMTHMINHPDLCVDEEHPKYEMWKYFNAFLGSQELYFITKCDNIKVAISGHVHYRKSFEEDNTYYMCRCLGYEREFKMFGGECDLKSQIDRALEVITI